MVAPEVVGHIDPVCLVELKDEREAGNRRAGLVGGADRLPSAPLAPATKTRIVSSLSVFASHLSDFAGLLP
jgi:hypothetical protein